MAQGGRFPRRGLAFELAYVPVTDCNDQDDDPEMHDVQRRELRHAVFDFNGTLATDGSLMRGIGSIRAHSAQN